MSKTLGNFIDMEKIDFYVSRYGEDAWRYYLITQGPLGSTDADFVYEKFHDIYNAHLVNTVGNCASRITAMIEKYCDGLVPPASSSEIRNQEADAIYRQHRTKESTSKINVKITELKCAVIGQNPVIRITTDEGYRWFRAS